MSFAPITNVILDGDDTLWPNCHLYHVPMYECSLILYEALGIACPYPYNLFERHFKHDTELVKTMGFSQERFPHSWVSLYEILAKELGLEPRQDIRDRLYAAAAKFREGPFVLYDEVKVVLGELRGMGLRVHVVTAGDLALQQKKIDATGVEPLVHSVTITGTDKKAALQAIARTWPESCAMVGDSKKSDVKPALDLGMTGIWVPSKTWSFAQIDLPEGSYREIKSIADLPALVRELNTR